MRRVAEAVLALSTAPSGFTASELAQKVRGMSGEAESAYGPRRAAYDLKKLRGKGMLRKRRAIVADYIAANRALVQEMHESRLGIYRKR